ncbi:uncharacterized protein LOC106012625 [Aplysia californica]|uniref:Uncharacterized protein LOC106012625 n=1 Tax=Aplysia californica TaxID=6500 RepID=A0ABM1A666_APLCA|nr:uncharacterized protein LOC106012625 [Aplysia californica]
MEMSCTGRREGEEEGGGEEEGVAEEETEVLLNIFVTQTNKYAQEFISSSTLKPASCFRQWTETNIHEMRTFLVLLLLMGIVKTPDLNSHWKVFQPGENIAIDESLLLRKGRLVFKQYIPLKRATFGIKSILLFNNSGYTSRFRVYTGKDEYTTDIDDPPPPDTQHLGRSGQEVFYLMLPLLNKGCGQLVYLC